MEIVLLWVVLSVAVAFWAARRGRGALKWFALSLLLSPLGGAALVAALPNLGETAAPTPETHVRCPSCAELVRKEARVCKHCGQKLVPIVD